ncbi:LptF/LptG family permease [Psychromarinibacter sp. S121]|uniref:LptF/LptG family permease n=1 Tax=Psychromarinibacter sp. S121 TaxID=3415127 RepID=UPI003C7A9DA8
MIQRLHSPMTRLLRQRALRTIVALLVLIESIFIADIFTSTLQQVLREGGSALDLLKILLLKSPEIVDFALPLVLFLGIYLAVTRARNANELVICAAASEPWTRIPRLAMYLGGAGFALSFLFSGLVTPLSNYVQRLALYELRSRTLIAELSDPAEVRRVREISGRTFIATPTDDPDAQHGGLFVYRPGPGGSWNVAQATDWDVVGPDENRNYVVRLQEFREFRGRNGEAPTEAPTAGVAGLDFARITVRTMELAFSTDEVLEKADESPRVTERYLFENDGPLWGEPITRDDGRRLTRPTRQFGEMLARAILCPVAAAVAVAAAAFSGTRRGRWLALPGGLLLVLAGDVASRAILGDAVVLGYIRFWPAALAIVAMGLAPALGYVWLRAERIVMPAGGRA